MPLALFVIRWGQGLNGHPGCSSAATHPQSGEDIEVARANAMNAGAEAEPDDFRFTGCSSRCFSNNWLPVVVVRRCPAFMVFTLEFVHPKFALLVMTSLRACS